VTGANALGRLPAGAGWASLGLALVLFVAIFVVGLWDTPGDDLSSLVVAGELLRRGQPEHLYDRHPVKFHVVDSAAFVDAARAIGFRGFAHPFVQVPLVAYAMKPLAALPFGTVRRGWLLASTIAVLAGLWLTLRIYLPWFQQPLGWALVLAALCAFEPLHYGLWLGQTTAFVFLLVVLALALERARWPVAAGLVLALAAFIKVTPALLALVWLWRGPRRALGGLAGGLSALAVLSVAVAGLSLHRAYLDVLRSVGSSTLVAYNNQSIVAFLTRMTVPYPEWFDWKQHRPPETALLAAYAMVAVLGLGAWWLLSRIPRPAECAWRPLAEAAALAVMLLAPSLSWSHYFLLLLPALVAGWAAAPARTRGPVGVLVAVAFGLCCRPIMPDQVRPVLDAITVVDGPMSAALLAGMLVLALGCWRVARPAQPTLTPKGHDSLR